MGQDYYIPLKDESESHADYSYRVIRQNILNLNLIPGEVISEIHWAEMLNESRMPVHQAIVRLTNENLCDVVPRKESRVSRISLSLANEGLFLRSTVEPAIIMNIAGNLSPNDIQKFRQNLAKQQEIVETEKDNQRVIFYEYDDSFHKLFYTVAHKQKTYELICSACGHLDRIRYLIRLLGKADLETSSYNHHCDLFQLLCFGVTNPQKMQMEYKESISAFTGKLDEVIAQFPEYFTD